MKHLIISFLLMTFLSCKESSSSENIHTEDATPEVLVESDYSSVKYDKKGRGGIMDALFNEALKKDQRLANLIQKMEFLYDLERDSLNAYRKFNNDHLQYFEELDDELSDMNDTILRDEFKAHFARLQANYAQKMKSLNGLNEKINQNEATLNDQKTMLKLLITWKMMEQYQKNEFPKEDPIHHVIKEQEKVMTKSKKYLQELDTLN